MFDLVETATDHGQQALYEVLGGSVILALDTTRLTVVCIPGQVVHTQCSSVTKLYEFGTAVSWAGNCGFGFALAMRRSVISTYGLTALEMEMSSPPKLQWKTVTAYPYPLRDDFLGKESQKLGILLPAALFQMQTWPEAGWGRGNIVTLR